MTDPVDPRVRAATLWAANVAAYDRLEAFIGQPVEIRLPDGTMLAGVLGNLTQSTPTVEEYAIGCEPRMYAGPRNCEAQLRQVRFADGRAL